MRKLVIAIVTLAAVCAAQDKLVPSANLAGVIVDSSGASISGARITIGDSKVITKGVSGKDGRFAFQLPSPGNYWVKIEKQGFWTVEPKVALSGQSTDTRIELKAHPEDTCCDYGVHGVDTTSSSTQRVVSDTEIQRLPVERSIGGVLSLP